MRVNISELLADRSAVRVIAYSEALEPPTADVTLAGPVEGEILLANTGRTVSLSGRLRAAADLVCGVCLAPFRQILDFPVAEEFGRSALPGTGASGGRAELGPEDFVVPVAPGAEVDLTEIVRQHLILALPIAPRCREGCRGLCPTCGADLNRGPCACAARETARGKDVTDGTDEATI